MISEFRIRTADIMIRTARHLLSLFTLYKIIAAQQHLVYSGRNAHIFVRSRLHYMYSSQSVD